MLITPRIRTRVLAEAAASKSRLLVIDASPDADAFEIVFLIFSPFKLLPSVEVYLKTRSCCPAPYSSLGVLSRLWLTFWLSFLWVMKLDPSWWWWCPQTLIRQPIERARRELSIGCWISFWGHHQLEIWSIWVGHQWSQWSRGVTTKKLVS